MVREEEEEEEELKNQFRGIKTWQRIDVKQLEGSSLTFGTL